MNTTLETQSAMESRIARNTLYAARLILVALSAAGGRMTRGDLSDALCVLSWRPTIGELSDAIRYCRANDRIEVKMTRDQYFDERGVELHLIAR